jgi:hypothetical protein
LFFYPAYFVSKASRGKANMPHGVADVLMLLALVALTEHVTGKLSAVNPKLEAVTH